MSASADFSHDRADGGDVLRFTGNLSLSSVGDLPDRHSPLADAIGEDALVDSFGRMRAAIARTLSHAEPHGAFLARVAGA